MAKVVFKLVLSTYHPDVYNICFATSVSWDLLGSWTKKAQGELLVGPGGKEAGGIGGLLKFVE